MRVLLNYYALYVPSPQEDFFLEAVIVWGLEALK